MLSHELSFFMCVVVKLHDFFPECILSLLMPFHESCNNQGFGLFEEKGIKINSTSTFSKYFTVERMIDHVVHISYEEGRYQNSHCRILCQQVMPHFFV